MDAKVAESGTGLKLIISVLQNIAAVSNRQIESKRELLSSRTFRFKSGPWRFLPDAK